MPPVVPQTRYWVYTINHPTPEDEEQLGKAYSKDVVTYGGQAHEIGEQGTPHLQGFVVFKTKQRLTAVKKYFTRAHLEPMNGKIEDSVKYISKQNPPVFYGEAPVDAGEKEKKRWEQALAAAKAGDFDKVPTDIMIRHYTNVHAIAT